MAAIAVQLVSKALKITLFKKKNLKISDFVLYMTRDYVAPWIAGLDLENYSKAPIWLEKNGECARNHTGRLEMRNFSFTVLQKKKIHTP